MFEFGGLYTNDIPNYRIQFGIDETFGNADLSQAVSNCGSRCKWNEYFGDVGSQRGVII